MESILAYLKKKKRMIRLPLERFKHGLRNIVRGGTNFPAALFCALLFTAIGIVEEGALGWLAAGTFALEALKFAAIFGMAFCLLPVTLAKSRLVNRRVFWLANGGGVVLTFFVFFLLYHYGAKEHGTYAYQYLTELAENRIFACSFAALALFTLLAASAGTDKAIASAFFMLHKAFFIALTYFFVLWLGFCGVAAAVEALLYPELNYKIYVYIAYAAFSLAFAVFLGRFPDFSRTEDPARNTAERQPRFMEILFIYIMIPVLSALTIVLLLWTGRILLTGEWPSFDRLAAIAAAYSCVGIWLYIMVTVKENWLATFYRRCFPWAALIILAFEAGALREHLLKTGFKTTEYFFALFWLWSSCVVLLMLLRRNKAYVVTFSLIALTSLLAVLPYAGYVDFPIIMQVKRLEVMLTKAQILRNGVLVPLAAPPEQEVRAAITDAVSFLGNTDSKFLPEWFDKKMTDKKIFTERLGFEQLPRDYADYPHKTVTVLLRGSNVQLLDISRFDWALTGEPYGDKDNPWAQAEGEKGHYAFFWQTEAADGYPALKILRNEQVILERSFADYFEHLKQKYPPESAPVSEVESTELSEVIDSEDLLVMVVFSSVRLEYKQGQGTLSGQLYPETIYYKEK